MWFAIVGASTLLGGCNTDQRSDEDQRLDELERVERAAEREDILHAPGVSIEDLVEEPARYDGQTVRIAGEVREMLNPRALVLATGNTQSVLVLTRERADPMGWQIQSGDQAVAIGIVRTPDTALIERQLGRELEPDVERALGSGPVVIARSIGRVEGDRIDWTHPAAGRARPGAAR